MPAAAHFSNDERLQPTYMPTATILHTGGVAAREPPLSCAAKRGSRPSPVPPVPIPRVPRSRRALARAPRQRSTLGLLLWCVCVCARAASSAATAPDAVPATGAGAEGSPVPAEASAMADEQGIKACLDKCRWLEHLHKDDIEVTVPRR